MKSYLHGNFWYWYLIVITSWYQFIFDRPISAENIKSIYWLDSTKSTHAQPWVISNKMCQFVVDVTNSFHAIWGADRQHLVNLSEEEGSSISMSWRFASIPFPHGLLLMWWHCRRRQIKTNDKDRRMRLKKMWVLYLSLSQAKGQ